MGAGTPRQAVEAHVALGANGRDARARLEEALAALDEDGDRLAAVSPPLLGPYEDEDGRPVPDAPPVLDAVAVVRTSRDAPGLLERLAALEARAGRVRDGGSVRALDLDLLVHGDEVRSGGEAPLLPHPRALERAFVLAPWASVAPLHVVPGTDRPVVVHERALRARRPEAFEALTRQAPLALPEPGGRCRVLDDAEALATWRGEQEGTVGLVPTMGALHAGHESLLRHARATCDAVLATIFVNPLQFGPGEDLARYPRTFDADRARLDALGVDAVYAPAADDLFGGGFATRIVVDGVSRPFEGALRPGHFEGVATVVHRLWTRTRPDRSFFGRKDAQQAAVLRRLARDLELGGEIVVLPTVREEDGLALSSRNRYLQGSERARARGLAQALETLVVEAATGEGASTLLARARDRVHEAGLGLDYVAIVDPDTMEQMEGGTRPVLALGAARAGATRLLDNRWVCFPAAWEEAS